MLPELAANKPGMFACLMSHCFGWCSHSTAAPPTQLRSPCTDLLCPQAQQPPPALPGLGAVLQAGETLQNLS